MTEKEELEYYRTLYANHQKETDLRKNVRLQISAEFMSRLLQWNGTNSDPSYLAAKSLQYTDALLSHFKNS